MAVLLRVAIVLGLLWPPLAAAQRSVGVAVVTDGPQYQLREVEQIFREELLELTSGEFAVTFIPVVAQWSAESVDEAMKAAYRNPDVDLVLVVGFAANQLTVSRDRFPKPTFLPLVFNPRIVGAPVENNRSGRPNLNYLADRVPIDQDLASFQRVVAFENAVVMSDEVILGALPDGPTAVRRAAEGVTFTFLGHDGVDHDLLARIPPDTDAILLGGLPRMPAEDQDALFKAIAERRLPSFSLVSESEVRRGALASDAVQTDFRRLARRSALNMQAVLLGERAQDQPVFFEGQRQLTINMETARRIGVSPRFDVLSEAVLLNIEPPIEGPELDLLAVARLALERNLDVAASRFDVDIGEQDVRDARANLLPSLSLGADYTTRRDSLVSRNAASPESATNAVVSLNQLVYSESVSSGVAQQGFLQQGRLAGFETVQLDQVLEATTAYLQALRAENQLRIQQDNLTLTKTNLELARDRVRVGSASNADIFRWESNLATARANVLAALAVRQQARESLNRTLNQPLEAPLKLKQSSAASPFTMSTDQFDRLIDNPQRYNWLVDFTVASGLASAPELEQLDASIRAAERDVVARRRAYWLPDFSVSAQYFDNLATSGIGSGTPADGIHDWNIGLSGSLPLYSGGSRRIALSRARLQRQQLEIQRAATAERIEQGIRAGMHAARASYANIDLSAQGAEAARKNLDLVSDAYRQGAVSIIELLDAQNQSLSAELSANNAVHDFLIDIMNLQRATGQFDFLLSNEEQQVLNDTLRDYIDARQSEAATRRSP